MTYAVIFKAQINQFDSKYSDMAEKLRDLAINQYGCLEFVAYTEGKQEVAISYWQSLEDINNWKEDKLHQSAQLLGKEKWYQNYQVQVVEVLREYSSN